MYEDVLTLKRSFSIYEIHDPKGYKELDKKFNVTKIEKLLEKMIKWMDTAPAYRHTLEESKINEDILDDARDALENEYDWTNVEFEGNFSVRFDYDRGQNSMWVNSDGTISGNVPSRNARGVWKALDKLGLKENKLTEKASITKGFQKAVEALQSVQLEMQKIVKKFVAEKDPVKKGKYKEILRELTAEKKAREAEFEAALSVEPIDLEESADWTTITIL